MKPGGVDAEADTGVRPASNNYVPQDVAIRVRRGTVRGRGPNQQKYLRSIATHDIHSRVGPAGTGKTFLAVASAVEALNESRVQRLVLVRTAVHAGATPGVPSGPLSPEERKGTRAGAAVA